MTPDESPLVYLDYLNRYDIESMQKFALKFR